MTDLLVRLYDLPEPLPDDMRTLAAAGVVVRRAAAYERCAVIDWVRAQFGAGWADECGVAFARQPIACFIATRGGAVIGFACHDSTCRNFFGPLGVDASAREKGIGRTLLYACLDAMRAAGYAYAIIGGVGDERIYRRAVGAMPIDGSDPGIYRDRLG